MGGSNTFTEELFSGLTALSSSTFPKKCKNCGRIYTSAEDFWQQTDSIGSRSGLKKGYDDDDNPIVELFRNCSCGSTLMDSFGDRRDGSIDGVKRRDLFEKLLVLLETKGYSRSMVRLELLNLIRGENSELLTKLGIQFKLR